MIPDFINTAGLFFSIIITYFFKGKLASILRGDREGVIRKGKVRGSVFPPPKKKKIFDFTMKALYSGFILCAIGAVSPAHVRYYYLSSIKRKTDRKLGE